jgi:glycosyltransferase involved in cell wall biosynthesis
MLNLALICGSWPPNPCGVGDYAHNLAAALRERGANVSCLGEADSSSIRGGLKLSASLTAGDFDLLHLQYPAIGFGRSLVPALMPLRVRNRPFVVTLHEFSTFKKIRRPWFLAFAHQVSARIFTNERERDTFSSIMRPTSGLDFVVPIASNIRVGNNTGRVPGSICNFGIISPGKGIEQFLELAELCRDQPGLSFSLIGAETKGFTDYARDILTRARKLGVRAYLNLPELEVADLLSSHQYAYLPFDDGASPRRGSLMAMQQNRVAVLTTHSEQTPRSMRDTTIGVTSPSEARDWILRFQANPQELEQLRARADQVQNPTWRGIATAHIDIYNRLLKRSIVAGDRK